MSAEASEDKKRPAAESANPPRAVILTELLGEEAQRPSYHERVDKVDEEAADHRNREICDRRGAAALRHGLHVRHRV